jgi:hypothetical protein
LIIEDHSVGILKVLELLSVTTLNNLGISLEVLESAYSM